MTVVWTNAPASYDYGYTTRTSSTFTVFGRKVDRVTFPADRGTWQVDRYLSGGYVVDGLVPDSIAP